MNAPFWNDLTTRELRWLRHMAIHGPQSSEFLLELCADTHSCRDTGLRALKTLRDNEYLRCPRQQDQIAKAAFNPNVYDLAPKATLHLKGIGDPEPVRPTGHWWHGFLTSSITSAVAIAAERHGYRYIPAHEILGRHGANLSIPFGTRKLIPDQLFALDYGGQFRSFVLEVDRGTEPYASHNARKSVKSMLRTYADLTAKDAIRRHYGLKSPLLILLAFSAPHRAARCLEAIEAVAPEIAPFALVQSVPISFPKFTPICQAVTDEWRRAGTSNMRLM